MVQVEGPQFPSAQYLAVAILQAQSVAAEEQEYTDSGPAGEADDVQGVVPMQAEQLGILGTELHLVAVNRNQVTVKVVQHYHENGNAA